MNYLTGLLVLVILFSTTVAVATPKITAFMDGCPLEGVNGLQVGDELYRIDGRRVYTYNDVGLLLGRNSTGKFDLTVLRNGQKVELRSFEMQQRMYPDENGGESLRYGLYFSTEAMTPGLVLKTAWNTGLDFARMVWMSLGDLLTGKVSVREMSGPVGIVSTVAEVGNEAESVSDGLLNVFYLLAFIAINLAVMNMLPIPALDGGRIALLLIGTFFTALTGKKIPSKYEGYLNAAMLILLLGFMAVITFKDIWTLIF